MTNFIDAKCPNCGRTDQLDVAATIWLRLCADGTDADMSENGDHEYGPQSLTCCAACNHSGRLSTFTAED